MSKTDIFARFALSFLCRPNIIALVLKLDINL